MCGWRVEFRLVSSLLAALALLFLAGEKSAADERDSLAVGLQPDGSILVPTNQSLKPAGAQVAFAGRPVDLELIEGGRVLVAKNMRDLVFIDVSSATIRQTLPLPSAKGLAESFSAVGLATLGEKILASDSQGAVRVAILQQDGRYGWEKSILLKPPAGGGVAYPTGMALQDESHLWVCASRGNELQLLNLENGEVETRVPVGVAPYSVVVAGAKAYVSNWGGDRPAKGEKNITTSGTPVRTDKRTSVANRGSVSVVANVQGAWRQVKTIPVGSHASGIVASPDSKFVYVTSANSDTISVIDVARDVIVETIDAKPEARLPFGSGSNAVAVAPDGRRLFVANGTGNCIASVALGEKATRMAVDTPATSSRIVGTIPTGWYPGAVRLSADGRRLYVANVKGHGSLLPRKAEPKRRGAGDGDDPAAPQARGKNSHDYLGTVSIIDVPDDARLAEYSRTVGANNRLAYSLAGLEKPRAGVQPAPVPERHGEPSVFQHVIYVIKENRTYDQVLGDMSEGNGDASLCIFGAKATPNIHKLAREFVLLDNFYCSGVLSADGHSWTNAAYATDYLEKQFGQFTRSYPYEGSDPLAFPTSGFLWDNAMAHQKSFRNYGEFVRSSYEPRRSRWQDLYDDYQRDTHQVTIIATPNLPSLNKYSHPHYPGFPLVTPDVYRAKLIIDELKQFEAKGNFPNLVYVFLPNDHTNGTRPNSPTPRAMVADNDLALGMIVEAVSKSRFWPTTCIVVTEDDPQNGFDHVDGHRTVGLLISPYTRRRVVESTCYNQTGLVKTIELMLGLPPMNQMDLAATPLGKCFTNKADLTPYSAAKNEIPLDEMNRDLEALEGKAREFALASQGLDLEVEDRADEDVFNRILWFSVRGAQPYPGGAGVE
jgi:DNA-binding beta-propeller fold protein YncE